MRKVVLNILIIIVINGCSVLKKSNEKDFVVSDDVFNNEVVEIVRLNNLSKSSFFIEKAIIKITNNEGSEKLLGSLKFEKPERYLLSIRTSAGIEAGRLLISRDSIMINDRINKKVFSGDVQFFNRKYGVPVGAIPLLFGDCIFENKIEKTKVVCVNGKVSLSSGFNGIKVKYLMDCDKGKTEELSIENSFNVKMMEIEYSNFQRNGSQIFPGKVVLKDLTRNVTIEILVVKVICDWKGRIEFIPGKNYESVNLE